MNRSWYNKLWRLRYFLLIPLDTLIFYSFNASFSEYEKTSLRTCWNLAKSLARGKYYEWTT